MFPTRRATRSFSFVLLSLGLTAATHAETQTRARVTIRGSGNDISIERTEVLATAEKKPELSRSVPEASVLSEAIRMKQAGSTDEGIVRYLKTHAAGLPVIVDRDTVGRLRKAGAGKSVIAYLASVSAIEIGDSGAVGGGPAAEPSTSPEPEYEPGYAAQYGYPIYGGYSAPVFPGRSGTHSFRRPGPVRSHQVPVLVRPMSPVQHLENRFLFRR